MVRSALVAALLGACGGDPPTMMMPPGDPGPADVQVTVNTSQRQAISPLIYGVNGDPENDHPGSCARAETG